MAQPNKAGLCVGLQFIAVCLALIALIGVRVAADDMALMGRLRATSTPQMYTVVELGPLNRYRQRDSVVLQGPGQQRVRMSLITSNTKAKPVGQQMLARIGVPDGPDPGTAAPEDLVQAGWWHWYGTTVILFVLAFACSAFGIYQLRKPPTVS